MKIFGSILIIVASIVASHIYEKEQKSVIKELNAILDFTEFIKNQIEYFSLPLNDIYAKYGTKNSSIIECIIKHRDVTYFKSEINCEINSTFRKLGIGYKKEQLAHLEYLCSRLNNEITRHENEYVQKVKVFRALSIFAGSCTVILIV